jgi:hypothetical protein
MSTVQRRESKQAMVAHLANLFESHRLAAENGSVQTPSDSPTSSAISETGSSTVSKTVKTRNLQEAGEVVGTSGSQEGR